MSKKKQQLSVEEMKKSIRNQDNSKRTKGVTKNVLGRYDK